MHWSKQELKKKQTSNGKKTKRKPKKLIEKRGRKWGPQGRKQKAKKKKEAAFLEAVKQKQEAIGQLEKDNKVVNELKLIRQDIIKVMRGRLMALYTSWDTAPKKVTSKMIDVTPFWVGEVRWSDAVIETTTGGKGLNKAACDTKLAAVISAQPTLASNNNVSGGYELENPIVGSYTLRLPRQTQGVIQAFNFLRKGTKWQKFLKRNLSKGCLFAHLA